MRSGMKTLLSFLELLVAAGLVLGLLASMIVMWFSRRRAASKSLAGVPCSLVLKGAMVPVGEAPG